MVSFAFVLPDLIYWEVEKQSVNLTLHLVQVKVGKQKYYVKDKEVEVMLADELAPVLKRFTDCNFSIVTVIKELVSSRKVSAQLTDKLKAKGIRLVAAITPHFFGPRVAAYCDDSSHRLFE